MPYDKGDFTQQGINGDVSALVRLNEKRVMKVVLSSDDESDNCDISGKVYDLLNGTSYDVGSGGGGDSIPKCTVTFNNNTADSRHIASYISDYTCLSNGAILKNIDTVQPSESATYTFMYQKDDNFYYIGYNSESLTLTNMVNCEIIAEGDWTGYISPIDETLDSSFTISAE